MNNIRMPRFTKATLFSALAMLIILPVSSIVLAFLFRNDIAPDKPKIVEESIKSGVSLFISLTLLIVSNTYTKKELDRKANALRLRTSLQLSSITGLASNIINTPDLLDRSLLERSTDEVIRANSQNEKDFKIKIESLNKELEVVRGAIVSSDPETGMICSDYLSIVSKILTSINSYLTQSSAQQAGEIKILLRSLLALL